jgi:predicted regulator of Ras-like GTPase activity (Roadblock/LC7/MglB family)
MTLKALLKQVLEIKGVKSAAVVDADGLVLEGVSAEGTDLSFVGGAIASSLASSKALAGLLGEGRVTQTMIEYENGPVLMTPLQAEGKEFVAVLTLDGSSALGRVRFQLRKLLPDLAQAVAR